MRPDEHKRKKNAAYKKKHGIGKASTTAAAADNATTSTSYHSQGKGKNESRGKDENKCETQGSKNLPNASLGANSSGSDSEVAEKKNFRRREIVSNWRKYDLEPECDGAVAPKGEDFEKLLNMAGEAMSRFRFKDEIEWENDDDRLGDGDGSDHQNLAGSSGILSLDLADIVSSMSCIPVHQLLGIDQCLFPVEQLESHMQSVAEKRKKYNDTLRQKDEQSKLSLTSHETFNNQLKSFTSDSENISTSIHTKTKENCPKVNGKPTVDRTQVNKVNESLHTEKDTKILGEESLQERLINEDVEKSRVKQSSHCEPSLRLMDDDLDRLLDMDVGKDTTSSSSVKKSTTSSADGHLNSNIGNTNCLSAAKKSTEEEADQLEDWLDSILD